MTLGRITAGINKADDRHEERANQVHRCVLTGLPDDAVQAPQFRGWICQEAWYDRSSVTFDLKQCAGSRRLLLLLHLNEVNGLR